MSLRFLLGLLPSGLPEENNQTTHEELNISTDGYENYLNIVIYYQNPAKFHIGMLTISLLVGIAYSGYTAYTCRVKQDVFLGYIRDLAIALTCRTFFSVVFDGAILLGTPYDVGGGNFLLSMEQICLNLVIAFWLSLNIYLHERVQSNFSNEPTLLIYQYGIPCVSIFFALVWIFTLQDQWGSYIWWIWINSFTQWIVNSINLLYLLIQLALLGNITRMLTKITLDNDGISLQIKCSAMMGVLVFIFLLQFSLNVGRVQKNISESYLYFYYLIDGLECGLICVVLYFFYKWVPQYSDKLASFLLPSTRTSQPNEMSLSGERGIVTIDSMFMTRESGIAALTEQEEGSRDVVYSNVIGPERLKKTLDLYKRLNIIPTNQVTTVEGEQFYDCQFQSRTESFETRFGSFTSQSNVPKNQVITDDKSLNVNETKQKKNAFYSSKYLILDSKESEIPKYLETRPSVSSSSEKGSFTDIGKRHFSDLNLSMTDELVRKWLDDVIEKKDKNEQRKPETANFSPEVEKQRPELVEDQNSTPKTIMSTINSVVSNVLFGSNADHTKEIAQPPQKTDLLVDDNEKKPITSTEKKSELDVAKFLPEETTRPQDVEFQQIFRQTGKKKIPVYVNESERPDDSNFKPEHLHGTKKQEKPFVVRPLPRKDEILKPIVTESYPKDQTELKTCDVPTKVTPTSIKQLPSLEFDPREQEKDKTPGESEDEIKHKPELAVLEALKDDLSVSHTVNELQIIPIAKNEEESQPEKFTNQNITYSDLLEFRSQRDKSATTDQSSGISKKLFDFSEAFTSTVGSWFNAGSSFFTTRKDHSDSGKDNESVILETKRKNLETAQGEKPQNELFTKPPTILPKAEPEVVGSSSESEFSIEKDRGSTSSAGSFSVDQYYSQVIKTKEKFYNQSNSTHEKPKKDKNKN